MIITQEQIRDYKPIWDNSILGEDYGIQMKKTLVKRYKVMKEKFRELKLKNFCYSYSSGEFRSPEPALDAQELLAGIQQMLKENNR